MDKEVARDGVLKNAKAELVRLAARYRVSPPGLKQAVAELTNAAGKHWYSAAMFFLLTLKSLSYCGSAAGTP